MLVTWSLLTLCVDKLVKLKTVSRYRAHLLLADAKKHRSDQACKVGAPVVVAAAAGDNRQEKCVCVSFSVYVCVCIHVAVD